MKKTTLRRLSALVLAIGVAAAPFTCGITAQAAEDEYANNIWVNPPEGSGKYFEICLFRIYNPYSGEHIYLSPSHNKAEYKNCIANGWKDEGPAWGTKTSAGSNTPVLRLYNPYSGDHHYTTSTEEYEKLAKVGWNKEGIAWYSNDMSQKYPVYRGYNPYTTVGTHHYTLSWQEMQEMVKAGWRYEGVAFYGTSPYSYN